MANHLYWSLLTYYKCLTLTHDYSSYYEIHFKMIPFQFMIFINLQFIFALFLVIVLNISFLIMKFLSQNFLWINPVLLLSFIFIKFTFVANQNLKYLFKNVFLNTFAFVLYPNLLFNLFLMLLYLLMTFFHYAPHVCLKNPLETTYYYLHAYFHSSF